MMWCTAIILFAEYSVKMPVVIEEYSQWRSSVSTLTMDMGKYRFYKG